MAVELPPIIQEIINKVRGTADVKEQQKLIKQGIELSRRHREELVRQRTRVMGLVSAYAYLSDRLVRTSKVMGALGEVTQSLTGAFTDLAVVPLLPAILPLINPMTQLLGFMADHQQVAAFTGAIILLGAALHRVFLAARIAGFIFHEAFTKDMRDQIMRLFGFTQAIKSAEEAMKELNAMRPTGGGTSASSTATKGVAEGRGLGKGITVQRYTMQAFQIHVRQLKLLALIYTTLRGMEEIAEFNLAKSVMGGIGKGGILGKAGKAAVAAGSLGMAGGSSGLTEKGLSAAAKGIVGTGSLVELPKALAVLDKIFNVLGKIARVGAIAMLVIGAAVGLFQAIGDMGEILEPIKPQLKAIGEGFAIIGGVIGTVFIVAMDALIVAFRLIFDSIFAIIGIVIALITGDWKAAWEIFTNLGRKAVEVLLGLGTRIDELLGGALSKFRDWIRVDAPEAIGKFFDSVGTWFKELPGKVAGWLLDVAIAFTTWVGNLKDSVVNIFKVMINTIINLANRLPGVSIPTLQAGTRSVQEDGLAMLHRGERVVPYDRSTTINGTQNVTINYKPEFANEGFGFATRHSMDLRFSFLGGLGGVR